MNDLISRQAAIDAMRKLRKWYVVREEHKNVGFLYDDVMFTLDKLLSAEPETCEGCKHLGKWENEVEYCYPSPCTRCKRRTEDHFEKKEREELN